MPETKRTLNPRTTFWKCGACSHAMFHLLNHEFDNEKEQEEKASDLLAGGIAQKGEQCGMLWGGALALGTESNKRYGNKDLATAHAIEASKQLVASFENRAGSSNCRDITQVDWENKLEMTLHMLKIVARGFIYSPCFNLITKWTPEAIEASEKGLSEPVDISAPCLSCASQVVKRMGGTEEESVMVAGFAGGLGLSGNACGALAAAIWFKMLLWSRDHPGKTPKMMKNPDVEAIINKFLTQTDSKMLCKDIAQKTFGNINEHTEYLKSGGCSELIETLASLPSTPSQMSVP